MAKPGYLELDVLRDEVGLVAPLTMREKESGYRAFTFAIFREFERGGGPTERTVYLSLRHIDPLRKLLDRIEERLRIEEDRINESRRRVAAP